MLHFCSYRSIVYFSGNPVSSIFAFSIHTAACVVRFVRHARTSFAIFSFASSLKFLQLLQQFLNLPALVLNDPYQLCGCAGILLCLRIRINRLQVKRIVLD